MLWGSVLSQWKNETRTNRCFWKGKSRPRCLGEVAWNPLQYLSWALTPWEASRAPWGLTGENFPFLASPPFCLCASRAVKPALHLGAFLSRLLVLSPLPVTAIFPVCPHSPCRIPACSSQRTGSRRASYLPSVSRLSPCITAGIMSTYDLGFFLLVWKQHSYRRNCTLNPESQSYLQSLTVLAMEDGGSSWSAVIMADKTRIRFSALCCWTMMLSKLGVKLKCIDFFYILSMCCIYVCVREMYVHMCVGYGLKRNWVPCFITPHIIPSRKSLLKNPELGWQSASSSELPIFAPRQQWGYKPSLLSLLHRW